jgi:glycine hydroxymethyltransferase
VQEILDKVGISTSKSTIPDDPNPPFKPSGLRIGTPAMTTRGIKEADAKRIVDIIHEAITHKDQPEILDQLRQKVIEFCKQFPVPGAK